MAAKIHELIPAEADRNEVAKALVEEAKVTFTKKVDHFLGHCRKVTMYSDERQQENLTDYKEVVTTVDDKLAHVWGSLIPAMDTTASKENSNCSGRARADVIVGGKVVLTGVPATALLGLEKRLAALKDLYLSIPTLDPSISWEPDAAAGAGHFQSKHDQEAQKTEKILKHKVLVPATDKHPAQVEKYTIDEPVAKISLQRFSGMVSPARKAELLRRITELATAVKEARQRANMAEVEELCVGEAIRAFIHAE